MKILILGGTVFLGRQLVNAAKERNHTITLFNRGIHNPDIFPEVERILGDRKDDLSALKGRTFDLVIDTSGHIPGDVRKSAQILKNSAGHYTFTSSISAYKNFSVNGIDENSETCILTDGNADTMTMENYGALKVLCENEVADAFDNRALNIRPGLIVGENDWSDRFTYWIHRINKGGNVLVPDAKNENIQFIDVKDLAQWIIQMAENGKHGLYNATGPDYKLNWENFISECMEFSDKETKINWVSEKFILDENVAPWTEIPMWIPKEDQGVNNVNISKALNDGLTFRLLKETLNDTLNFSRSRGSYELRSGLKAEKEIELLEKWSLLKH